MEMTKDFLAKKEAYKSIFDILLNSSPEAYNIILDIIGESNYDKMLKWLCKNCPEGRFPWGK